MGKSLALALQQSLKRLRTDYIDIYWLHMWDGTTRVAEVMRALDDAVRAGKVLHIVISDTPAWIIAQANTMAELRDWTQFAGRQAEYSLVRRDAERDLLPMCAAFEISPMAWSPLGNGVLTGKYNRQNAFSGRLSEGSRSRNRTTPKMLAIAEEVIQVADEIGASPSQVALAWTRRINRLIPLIGARTPEQLQDNLGCTEVILSEAHLNRLDQASAFDAGFPHDFLRAEFSRKMLHGEAAEAIDGLP